MMINPCCVVVEYCHAFRAQYIMYHGSRRPAHHQWIRLMSSSTTNQFVSSAQYDEDRISRLWNSSATHLTPTNSTPGPQILLQLDDAYDVAEVKPPSSINVPTTMSEAISTFFMIEEYPGPRYVSVLLLGLVLHRIQLGGYNVVNEFFFAMISMIAWWFQEHIMHKYVLHSNFNWIGKHIHERHHQKPYHHISIDAAPLMIIWLTVVHLFLRYSGLLPYPIALTMTIAYGIAGLFYEWAHYIVHTKVRFSPGSYWRHIKSHHARHHQCNHDYWFAFSMTQIDDLFGTNPNPSQVLRRSKIL
jgi:Fatty acid hydroxylase superfamily